MTFSEGYGNADRLSVSSRDWIFLGPWPCPMVSSRLAIAERWTAQGTHPSPVCQLQASVSSAKKDPTGFGLPPPKETLAQR